MQQYDCTQYWSAARNKSGFPPFTYELPLRVLYQLHVVIHDQRTSSC